MFRQSHLIVSSLLLITIGANCQDFQFSQFYEGTNFEGLIWQGTPPPASGCTALPSQGRNLTASIVTSVCLRVFPSATCTGAPDFALHAGQYDDLSLVQHISQNATKLIGSFRQCREDEGDKSVHLELKEIMDDYPYPFRAVTLVEYYNLTECTNLPMYARGHVDSVENHGNCMVLFDSTNCTGSSLKLQGGTSTESVRLTYGSFKDKALSVAPCSS